MEKNWSERVTIEIRLGDELLKFEEGQFLGFSFTDVEIAILAGLFDKVQGDLRLI